MSIIDIRPGVEYGGVQKTAAIAKYLKETQALLTTLPTGVPIEPTATVHIFGSKYLPDGSFDVLERNVPDEACKSMSFAFPFGTYSFQVGVSNMDIVDSILFKTVQLFGDLDGSDVEVDTYSPNGGGVVPRDADFWSSWKKSWDFCMKYESQIYPKVIDQLIPELTHARGDQRGVDLFGGDGRFVRLLAGYLPFLNKEASFEWHVVDNDASSLESARERSRFPVFDRDGKRHELGFTVHDPIDLTDANNRKELFAQIGKCNLVTILGGLNSNVIATADAVSIAEDIHRELLAPGGLCVVTGLTKVLLNADMFSSTGFTVEQMTIPRNIWTPNKPEQLYVLRNP
ncbi:MAG: hypothetical protein Q8Q49_02340 [bacterium]|nr:hypothetical protein [bacterium]